MWYSDVRVRLLPQPAHITSTAANTIHTRLHNNYTVCFQLFFLWWNRVILCCVPSTCNSGSRAWLQFKYFHTCLCLSVYATSMHSTQSRSLHSVPLSLCDAPVAGHSNAGEWRRTHVLQRQSLRADLFGIQGVESQSGVKRCTRPISSNKGLINVDM